MPRNKENKQKFSASASSHRANSYFKLFLKLFIVLLAITALPVWSLIRQIRLLSPTFLPTGNDCTAFFNNHTYNIAPYYQEIKINLFGEIHGSNEQYVASCLESKASPGDHLLIEATDNGGEIACDTVHKAYRRFNGKLKCYGFDVGIDKNRVVYNDLVYRVNFIAQKSQSFFINANSAEEIANRITDFANFLIENSAATPLNLKQSNSDFIKRNAIYLKMIADMMRGLTISQMKQFLVYEHDRLFKLAEEYELKSRKGPTNVALANKIISHHQQIKNSKFRLFAVTGAKHISLRHNLELKENIIDKGVPIAILAPNQP